MNVQTTLAMPMPPAPTRLGALAALVTQDFPEMEHFVQVVNVDFVH